MPLEAHLDLAQDVVVGRITEVKETPSQPGDTVHWGSATVVVTKTLKGVPTKIIKFLVVVQVDPGYGGSAVVLTHGVGESGIWLIRSDGVIDGSYGLVPESRKTDIQQMLKALAERRWSKSVNGLQAWSAVVHTGYHPKPVIIFAVRNVSQSDIYFPSEISRGLIALTATSQDGKVTDVIPFPAEQPERVFCRRLPAGETRYVHPRVSFIDLLWPERRLPPGEYSVVVACRNTQEGEAAGAPGQTVKVAAWKGQLEAPPVDILLSASDTQKKDAQQAAPADANQPRR